MHQSDRQPTKALQYLCRILLTKKILNNVFLSAMCSVYRGADKSLTRPGSKQARKHGSEARDFNDIETRAVIKLCFLQGKAPKEIHAILTETLDFSLPGRAKFFLPVRAKDLSAPL